MEPEHTDINSESENEGILGLNNVKSETSMESQEEDDDDFGGFEDASSMGESGVSEDIFTHVIGNVSAFEALYSAIGGGSSGTINLDTVIACLSPYKRAGENNAFNASSPLSTYLTDVMILEKPFRMDMATKKPVNLGSTFKSEKLPSLYSFFKIDDSLDSQPMRSCASSVVDGSIASTPAADGDNSNNSDAFPFDFTMEETEALASAFTQETDFSDEDSDSHTVELGMAGSEDTFTRNMKKAGGLLTTDTITLKTKIIRYNQLPELHEDISSIFQNMSSAEVINQENTQQDDL